jgi:hypothetical protein
MRSRNRFWGKVCVVRTGAPEGRWLRGPLWRVSAALALGASFTACSSPPPQEGPDVRAVVASGAWEGGPWRLLDVAPEDEPDPCIALEPVDMAGCTYLSSVKPPDVGPLMEGGGPGSDRTLPYRYIVVVGPRRMESVQARVGDAPPRSLHVSDIPGTQRRVTVYIAEPETYERTSLVVREVNGDETEVLAVNRELPSSVQVRVCGRTVRGAGAPRAVFDVPAPLVLHTPTSAGRRRGEIRQRGCSRRLEGGPGYGPVG